MQVGTDTLGIQHARRASEMASEVSKVSDADLETRTNHNKKPIGT